MSVKRYSGITEIEMSFENTAFTETVEGQNWLASVKKILRGTDFEALRTRTLDGLVLEPLYQGASGHAASLGRTSNSPWAVFQQLGSGSAEDANRGLLTCLENGCTGVDLVLPSAPAAQGAGLSLRDSTDLETLFSGVDLSAVEIRITGQSDTMALHAGLLAYAKRHSVGLPDLRIAQSLDITLDGNRVASRERAAFLAKCLNDQNAAMEQSGLNSRLATLDTRPWHNAGANNVVELALCAAQLVELLRLTENAGLSPDAIARRLDVVLVADADQFGTISKFRAARLLIDQVLSECRIETTQLPLHGETSWRMMSARDPWVNLLRTTMACFAAGVGGADGISVLPFTTAVGPSDELADRLARNTQSILIEESNLCRVSDPAAGSGVVEQLTTELAMEAWRHFQAVEKSGGLIAAWQSGAIMEMIDAIADKRSDMIRHSRMPITGVSSFPKIDEQRPSTGKTDATGRIAETAIRSLPEPADGERFDALADLVAAGKPLGPLADIPRGEQTAAVLAYRRLPEPFEDLRDRAEQAAMKGRKPRALLLCLGKLASYSKRATYAQNFFEAAGIETSTVSAADAAIRPNELMADNGSALICLCGSTEAYVDGAPALISALKAAGAKRVYLSGDTDDLPDLKDSDADERLFEGCDMIGILEDALDAA